MELVLSLINTYLGLLFILLCLGLILYYIFYQIIREQRSTCDTSRLSVTFGVKSILPWKPVNGFIYP